MGMIPESDAESSSEKVFPFVIDDYSNSKPPSVEYSPSKVDYTSNPQTDSEPETLATDHSVKPRTSRPSTASLPAPITNSIKLYIANIPLNMTEKELHPYFEEFNPSEVTILHDKITKEHKGSGFVTFDDTQDALNAIQKLHKKITLPGAAALLHCKRAGKQNLRKLYVGKLDYSVTDDILSSLFEKFGELEECFVLKNDAGLSRGCGFVKYESSFDAELAIQEMKGFRFGKGEKEIIVEFASSDRGTKRSVSPPRQPVRQPQQSFPRNYHASYPQPPYPPAPQFYPYDPRYAYSTPPLPYDPRYMHSRVPARVPEHRYTQIPIEAHPPQFYSQNQSSKVSEGPNGANLFVYNIPNNYSDDDLSRLFCSFGNVVSARILRDRNTNQSRGYGFVSFDHAASAQTAIKQMNGFHISGKRLKVEPRKTKARTQ